MSEFEVRDKEGFAAKLRSTLRHGLPNLQIKAPDDHSRTSSDGRTTKDATTEIFMLTKKKQEGNFPSIQPFSIPIHFLNYMKTFPQLNPTLHILSRFITD